MRTKTATIPWKPFSPKHTRYIRRALSAKISIAEGAIRSGKTIDHCLIATAHLETCADRIHLATGSTVRNAKLNIGDCNGFGLEYLFRGRCRWGKYKDNEALYLQTQTGEKVLIFAGGGKADSYKGILGNSYGLWIATEINEHYDSEDSRTSFVKVAMGRQLAAIQPKILWDLNPSNPNADIYSKYIDPYHEQGLANYALFTIYDNASLSSERIAEIERRYIPGTVWHTRDILGKRCVAEGLIYRFFSEHKEEYLIAKKDIPRFSEIIVGCDWGGNKSAHSFTATGITPGETTLVALCAERHPAKDTDAYHVSSLFNTFIARVEAKYGKVTDGYGDSEGQTLKNTVSNNGPIQLRDSRKHKIKDRIDATMFLIAQRRFFYTEDCEPLVKALCEAVWDTKKPDTRLDDGTTWIDPLDSFEYSWERYIPYFLTRNGGDMDV